MKLNFIPKFFFYSNTDINIFIQNSHEVLMNINKHIFDVKTNINYFFNLYNFVLIYFYIGNYFIKSKLKKTLNNLLHIYNNYYICSDKGLSFFDNIKNFLNDSKNKKIYNLNKVLFLINNNYYFPLDIFKIPYFYFSFVYTYFNLYLRLLNFFKLNILNNMKSIQDNLIKRTLC
jgi:hypothetical protein